MRELEALHELDELLHAGERHGVVDGRAHAAHDAVTLEVHETCLSCLLEELRIELFVAGDEGNVHERAAPGLDG